MNNGFRTAVVVLSMATLIGAGCASKKPKGRPPVDELAEDGRGLQGKDVISSSDKMANSLLSLPALNASREQWTIVVDRVENLSTSQRQNFDIFLERLRSKLIEQGQGRVQLVQNMSKFHEMRAKEIEPTGDRFGQGGPGAVPATVQPDYFLSARLSELPNRETSYFLVTFDLTKTNRAIVWSGMYEVATYR